MGTDLEQELDEFGKVSEEGEKLIQMFQKNIEHRRLSDHTDHLKI